MNTELWHADIVITDDLVLSCLKEQFPNLLPISKIQLLGEGWDNKVFLINKKIIFRFPRRKIATELIERENSILKNLQSIELGLEIPKPCYIGKPTTVFPYSFHGYNLLEGIAAYHARLNFAERLASLPALALFLKKLHSINETQALEMGALPQVFDRTNLAKIVIELNERLEKIKKLNLVKLDEKIIQREIITVQNIQLPKSDRCLVHGDLYCRHLLFHHKKLTAIIDWGDVGINNRAVDLAVIWSFYPQSCHQQFFEMYGSVDSFTWKMAQFLALYVSITVLLYSHDINDKLLFAESINAIKQINPKFLKQ